AETLVDVPAQESVAAEPDDTAGDVAAQVRLALRLRAFEQVGAGSILVGERGIHARDIAGRCLDAVAESVSGREIALYVDHSPVDAALVVDAGAAAGLVAEGAGECQVVHRRRRAGQDSYRGEAQI